MRPFPLLPLFTNILLFIRNLNIDSSVVTVPDDVIGEIPLNMEDSAKAYTLIHIPESPGMEPIMTRWPLKWTLLFSCVFLTFSESLHAQKSTIYTGKSEFGIPFRVDSVARKQQNSQEVRLYVSSDQGELWKLHSSIPIDNGPFTWESKSDGEYWFAVRTVDGRGKLHPNTKKPLEPELQVIVDTQIPRVTLTPQRTQEQSKIRWHISDANLAPSTLVLEFSLPPSPPQRTRTWHRIKVLENLNERTGPISGQFKLPTNLKGLILIRAQVKDQAGNQGHAQVHVDFPTRNQPVTQKTAPVQLTRNSTPVRQPMTKQPRTSSTSNRPMALPGTNIHTPSKTAKQTATPPETPAKTPPSRSFNNTSDDVIPFDPDDELSPVSETTDSSQPSTSANPSNKTEEWIPLETEDSTSKRTETRPITNADQNIQQLPSEKTLYSSGDSSVSKMAASRPSVDSHNVDTTDFVLNYRFESIGSSGIQSLLIFVSENNGKTWQIHSSIPFQLDPSSPKTETLALPVHVKQSGNYGFIIIPVSGSGISEEHPSSGDSAQISVDVDNISPKATLHPIQIGDDDQGKHLLIRWKVSDWKLTSTPISLAWSESIDGPWSPIAKEIENSQSYRWRSMPHTSNKVFLRLKAQDTAGNITQVVTKAAVDLQKPRISILGVSATKAQK